MREIFARLNALAASPPPSLLIEGGSEAGRLKAAVHWAKALNCEAKDGGAPCGQCAVCRRVDAGEHPDVWYFDGRISNKEDEENPGKFAALRVENLRALKGAVGVKPKGDGKRVVVIQGMGATREEALNTMLKTLEEPGEFTVFALLAPQRAQILPTLVSRSLCLTLPWESSGDESDGQLRGWENEMGEFIERGGASFLEKISAKGQVDAILAAEILKCCQRALARAAIGEGAGALDRALRPLGSRPDSFALGGRWLFEAQEALSLGVSPQRTLEAVSARLYALRNSSPA